MIASARRLPSSDQPLMRSWYRQLSVTIESPVRMGDRVRRRARLVARTGRTLGHQAEELGVARGMRSQGRNAPLTIVSARPTRSPSELALVPMALASLVFAELQLKKKEDKEKVV
jgi:hypothetical protein